MALQNHLVIIILDSCRYDSFERANTSCFDQVGPLQKRYSYASWTSPSHYAILMGQLPHANESGRLAAEIYDRELRAWPVRLGQRNLSNQNFIPHLSLPAALSKYNYYSEAFVSMPVLHEATGIARHFDHWQLTDMGFDWMIEQINFQGPLLKFYFLNLSETHFPYGIKDPQPYVQGWNGVARDNLQYQGDSQWQGYFFDRQRLDEFHKTQIGAVERCNLDFQKLWEKSPPNTYFIISSDHGECFGEGGFFGHGPTTEQKVFEVPLIEGVKKL